ncbi:redox-sensing transcriptional repressor Rex [Paeniglutamicibacter sp. ABSL32-1]|uniref:redox-sensing transcriptional repressor Rex n=1 Tax=Paeniglutamicibacter quisquiliarum TaxID=2849498 RepID=UPI001C2DD415|nr:redox-sensing transcriptional repressor Rex [Paeniglutamicibacter quisquiliarum]MBV1780693.1 redox-sensing transcriptional repressor Rex [Paeniglutamicibacter quisquiliarum]
MPTERAPASSEANVPAADPQIERGLVPDLTVEQTPTGSLGRLLPEATLARLTQYLRALNTMQTRGEARTSSGVLATEAGVNPAILRKDLSLLGSYGTRGVGYVVTELAEHISKAMGLLRQWRVAIIGAGNLGRALSGYGGFRSRGFEIVALLDSSPEVIGSTVGDLQVQPILDLDKILEDTGANMAVLSVPGAAAQDLCDKLVASGVRSILSFAPVVLHVPAGVNLRKVDLATELQILAYHAQNLDS